MIVTCPSVRRDVTTARSGDADAFARLVRSHASTVCAITTAVLGDARAGEEVAQEVFLAAWQGLGGLRDPDTFAAWLRQIARNRARNALRTRARRSEVPGGAALDELPDPSADLLDRFDDARCEAALWAALDGMDGDHREVLVLFYREGRSVREVAERLELDEPTVRKRLSRARSRLRDDVMETLGRHLARTRPGLAFLLGISAALAGLAPLPARAAPRRSVVGAVAGGVCLAVLAWVAMPCPAEMTAGPRPSETRSGHASLAARSAPPTLTPMTASPPAEAVLRLRIRPGEPRPPGDWVLQLSVFRPNRFWPTLDEAPFPRGRRTAALVDFVTEGPHDLTTLPDDILDRTRALRTDEVPDDPWAALVALEVERLHAMSERYQAEAPAEDDPPLDLDTLLALARGTREAWPDHPVADYAALYELTALGEPNTTTEDPRALGRLAMDLVRSSSDPYVLDAAISEVSNAGTDAELDAEDLDLLLATYDDPDAVIPRYGVAALALDTALELDDLDRAASWMTRYDRSTEDLCADDRIPADRCSLLRDHRDHRSAWLSAMSAREPVSWQAALIGVVHLCPEPRALTGEGRFDGGWRWTWSDDGPFADCIAAAPVQGPVPPDGTSVALEVLAPRIPEGHP